MEIIQSFWSKGSNFIDDSSGWLSPKFHWLSWILSANQLVKYHKNVVLYTDQKGKEILVDKLHLPYTKVHVVLDELDKYHKNLWAIGKIKTYQLQDKPFIHVDGDVFVWDKLDRSFQNSQLVTQNLERTTEYYRTMWDNIGQKLHFIPSEISRFNSNINNLACNMGIVGGSNLSFFKEYTECSFDFVDKNKRVWDVIDAFNFNIFFEQVLFYEMASNKQIKIDFLFNDVPNDNSYTGFGDFDKVPQKTYLHLLGFYKKNPTVCRMMEIYVMKHYPSAYNNLIKLTDGPESNSEQSVSFSQKENNLRCANFENHLLNGYQFKNNKSYLLSRDLYNEGLPIIYDCLIHDSKDFWIIKIKGFAVKPDYLEITELNISNTTYAPDEYDDIVLHEIGDKKIRFSKLSKKLLGYIDSNDINLLKEYNFLFTNRLRNYLKLKLISIVLIK